MLICEPYNIFENVVGKLVDQEGSWQHGSDGARAGLMMPGIGDWYSDLQRGP